MVEDSALELNYLCGELFFKNAKDQAVLDLEVLVELIVQVVLDDLVLILLGGFETDNESDLFALGIGLDDGGEFSLNLN